MKQVVHTACPHDCPDACGVLITVEDGRATKIQGDPEHPVTRGFLCAKVAKYLDRVYSPDRVLYPMRRIATKGPVVQQSCAPEGQPQALEVATKVRPGRTLFTHICHQLPQAAEAELPALAPAVVRVCAVVWSRLAPGPVLVQGLARMLDLAQDLTRPAERIWSCWPRGSYLAVTAKRSGVAHSWPAHVIHRLAVCAAKRHQPVGANVVRAAACGPRSVYSVCAF